MGNIVLYIVLCLMLPIALLCFYLEHRARRLMISFLCGVLSCLAAYYLNDAILGILQIDNKYFTTTFAPMVEEILKFLPIFIIGAIVKKGKRGSTANAFAVGIGFSVVENFYYLFSGIENVNLIWVISRCVGTGLMHGMSATIIGLGIFLSRSERKMKPLYILSSLFFAFIYHGLFNLLVQADGFRFFGILLPIVTYLTVLAFLKKSELQKLFSEEET